MNYEAWAKIPKFMNTISSILSIVFNNLYIKFS